MMAYRIFKLVAKTSCSFEVVMCLVHKIAIMSSGPIN